ncbi:MAG: DUF819 family protein [Planctomycetota bacterium]
MLAGGGGEAKDVLITNHAVIFGILMMILGAVFWTANHPKCKWFYKIVPMLLLCYFLPSLLALFGIVDPGDKTLYRVATRYLLPATLVLLTMSIDLKEIFKLGPKALVMFITGTIGVVIGGPIAVLVVGSYAPHLVGGDTYDEKWRGYSTVAGSWIGGGANQLAMKELYLPEEDMDKEQRQRAADMFSVMVAVDVIVAEFWMAFLILGVGYSKQIDKFFGADASSVDQLQIKMEKFTAKKARIPTTTDLMVICAIGFGVTAIAHLLGYRLSEYFGQFAWASRFSIDSSFFWLIVLTTLIGIGMSFTKIKDYEGAGASKLGTIMIYILVAVIGMSMDISALTRYPGYFLVGGIWMLIHVGLLFLVGALIKAPYFFLAVGSKANIGGAASAPVVAGAFHPSLAPVGVLLAVLGYAVGTFGAWLCAIMMSEVAADAVGQLVRDFLSNSSA